MGTIKTFALAGGLVIASTFAASAADLPPPPPPYAAPPPVEFSGWYLRGDVGVSSVRAKEWYHASVDAAPGGQFLRQSMGDSAFVGVGVGYQFNSWARFDLTGEYRISGSTHAIDRYDFTCPFAGGSCGAIGDVITRNNIWNGSYKSLLFLANFYADLGTWHGFTPYLGVGVGAARNSTTGIYEYDPSDLGGAGWASPASKWAFAWALHAGLGYSVTQNLKLDVGYRYVNLGDAPVGTLTCLPGPCAPTGNTGAIRKIDAHEIKLGMRWMFNDVPAYMPRPVYAKN